MYMTVYITTHILPPHLPWPCCADEDSGSDEECLSRDAMKRNTVALVDAKTKKKPQDDDDEEDSKKKRKRR